MLFRPEMNFNEVQDGARDELSDEDTVAIPRLLDGLDHSGTISAESRC